MGFILQVLGYGNSYKENKEENIISEINNEKINKVDNINLKGKEINEGKNDIIKIDENNENEQFNKIKIYINEEQDNEPKINENKKNEQLIKSKIDKNQEQNSKIEKKQQINKIEIGAYREQSNNVKIVENEEKEQINKLKNTIVDEKNKKIIEENQIKEQNNILIKIKKKNYNPENIEECEASKFKKIINIPLISDLDYFTTKDIQNKNKIITREIVKKAIKQIKDDDKIRNQNIVEFLKNIAYISRKSFIKSKNLLELVINDVQNNLKKNFNLNIENDKKYLSSFVKKNIDNNYLYVKYFKKENNNYSNEQIYLEELFSKLSIFYFHCKLAFPPIKINFLINGKDFNPETMIDFLNYGKGKVNFVFLPSLFSNQNFLYNAKLWVYTYNENEYFLDEESLNSLNEILK